MGCHLKILHELIKDTCPIDQIQLPLGHDSIQMTEKGERELYKILGHS
jgi:hypothetical protein